MNDLDELKSRVDAVSWHHSIDLKNGIITPGNKSLDLLKKEADAILGPVRIEGASVADIGAWNGYFSVESKYRGARQVTAIDHFSWTHPTCRGRESIEIVLDQLGVEVELKQYDVKDTNVENVGMHDIVLFLGVFYHLFDAQSDLKQISELAKDLLVVETHQDGHGIERPAMVFYPGDVLGGDESNWWGPNPELMYELLTEAGFARVFYSPHPTLVHGRGIFHAFRDDDALERLDVSLRGPSAKAMDLTAWAQGSPPGGRRPAPWQKAPARTFGNVFKFLTKQRM